CQNLPSSVYPLRCASEWKHPPARQPIATTLTMRQSIRPSMPPNLFGGSDEWTCENRRRGIGARACSFGSLLFQQFRHQLVEAVAPLGAAEDALPVDQEHRRDLANVVLGG